MIRRILVLVYLCTLPLVAGAFLSQWISPNLFWPPAFLGLIFPVLIILQIAFILIFILFRSKAVLLPVLVILAGWSEVRHTFQLNFEGSEDQVESVSIKVMTYNVRLLDFYKWSVNKNAAQNIFNLIRKTGPDILCLQELMVQFPGKYSIEGIQAELGQLQYSHFDFYHSVPTRKHGIAIFSRHPIIHSGSEHFPGTSNMIIFADIKIGADTIRVYNNHLESNHFEQDEFELIDKKSNEGRITREKISVITGRMKVAYKRRANQSDVLHGKILESPYPVIVCGDFNDTPVSYTINRVRKGLYDSFRSGGRGMGVTFPGLIIPLRIDYILHDKEMVSSDFLTGKEIFSDHRPVSCSIRFR